MNVINEMPEDMLANRRRRWYRFWYIAALYLALAPICALLVAVALDRSDQLSYAVLFIGMMISALGIVAAVFTYRSGH